MSLYIHEGPSLYLTASGEVVEEGDPRAATLLVATGSWLPPDVAAQHGLGAKARGAPSNKLRRQPAADKGVEIEGQEGERPADAEPGEQVVEFVPAPALEEAVEEGTGDEEPPKGKGRKG